MRHKPDVGVQEGLVGEDANQGKMTLIAAPLRKNGGRIERAVFEAISNYYRILSFRGIASAAGKGGIAMTV